MKKYLLITFFICSCSLELSDNDKTEDKGIIKNENGISIEHNGIEREYVLYVPNSYNDSSSVPLLFNFHGGGGSATGQMYISKMNLVADTATFIVVYPQGSSLDNGVSHWNSMIATEDNKSTADDIGFISILIDEISSNYNINPQRVYACGYSNGADFSFSLACYLSDKISAISSVSGLMSLESESLCNPKEATGVLIFNGTSDSYRPYNGINGYYLSIENTLEYWSNFHDSDSIKVENFIDNNDNNIQYFEYLNSNNNSYVQHYKLINGGHDWFNLSYQGDGIDEIIWSFFSNNSLE
jgi:polyhydroxybutyrate depolymerase